MEHNNTRMEYVKNLIKEVLGPRRGVEEILKYGYDPDGEDGGSPFTEYITGVIVPEDYLPDIPENSSPDSEILVEENEGDDSSSDYFSLAEIPSLITPKSPPKSFGISFTVSRSSESTIDVCVTWARYRRIRGSDTTVWKREPHHYIKRDISLDSLPSEFEIYRDDDGGNIIMSIHRMDAGREDINVTVIFINRLKYDHRKDDISEKSVFQPSIRVNVKNAELRSVEDRFEDDDVFYFLHRNYIPKARGHMCSAIWKDIDYTHGENMPSIDFIWPDHILSDDCEEFVRADVRSEFVPLYALPNPDFSWPEGLPSPELRPSALSDMWNPDVLEKALNPLVRGYELWIEENERLASRMGDENPVWKNVLTTIIERQRIAAERLRAGVRILIEDEYARLAFNFANRVISLQNQWSVDKKYRAEFAWRPFQLAFLLINIEPIVNRDSNYRKTVDLLWIPTGGGKTEAYLAVMAFYIAWRRLKHTRDNEYHGYGTAVILRYTLRLLTIQQFRRILKMITAAEYLRTLKTERGEIGWRPAECSVRGDYIYGKERFSIGMWVGGGVSPNRLYHKSAGALNLLKNRKSGDSNPAQILKCPVCGSWLSIPDSGLPQESPHTLHWIAKCPSESVRPEDLKASLVDLDNIIVENISVTYENVWEGNCILSIKMRGRRRAILREDISELWNKLKKQGFEVLSFSEHNPGYIPLYPKGGDTPFDFGIYCLNPDCHLNTGVYHSEMEPSLDGENLIYKEREPDLPFPPSGRVPIPAYTVDDQIYHRVPTIIISTVDKIARIAFEPRAAHIFGNVSEYHPLTGYYRTRHADLLPPDSPFWRSSRGKMAIRKGYEEECVVLKGGFLPPELIIQDELHLISGPLGSMFGLYEVALDVIISECWKKFSNNEIPTRYIASTATIRKAEHQVTSLFTRSLFLFPPHGLEVNDNFFSRYPAKPEDRWDPNKPGRLYMGISAPGKGPHTPLIRIWSSLLHTGYMLLQKHGEYNELKHYWTVVGYFNSIRELGGARALYREDIVERLRKQIMSGRFLDPARVYELSSRISSTHIPIILERMENDPSNPVEQMMDAIFTTSMFGTGVDVPHLSLMVVDGQPKTTSSYIQATGRVGRRKGALIVTFFNVTKPRDLSHYELFPAYHMRLHLGVEPPSVAPYSIGAVKRAGGPVIVGTVRNMCGVAGKWYDKNKGPFEILNHREESEYAAKKISQRIEIMCGILDLDETMCSEVRKEVLALEDKWFMDVRGVYVPKSKSNRFKFFEYPHPTYGLKKPSHVVLGDPIHQNSPVIVVYENAPQSLRDVEEMIPFEV